jgi:hypothetical protein
MQEAGVVDALMMEVAQGDRVVQIGAAPARPRSSMVELAPREGPLAPIGRTRVVRQTDADALMV